MNKAALSFAIMVALTSSTPSHPAPAATPPQSNTTPQSTCTLSVTPPPTILAPILERVVSGSLTGELIQAAVSVLMELYNQSQSSKDREELATAIADLKSLAASIQSQGDRSAAKLDEIVSLLNQLAKPAVVGHAKRSTTFRSHHARGKKLTSRVRGANRSELIELVRALIALPTVVVKP